jgi:adenylate kinase family enzyme
VILLMGLPGSGKGTQGKMLADQVGLHLISMGELVRLYVTGERRKEMLRGKLLSDDEVINMTTTLFWMVFLVQLSKRNGCWSKLPTAAL